MPVITKRLLDSIKADGALHILTDDTLEGFGAQITPAGAISFCITYRIGGRQKRRVIGRYGPMTVDIARKRAAIALGKAADGDDPRPDLASACDSVDALFETWMARHAEIHLKPNTCRYYRDVYAAQCRHRFGRLNPKHLTFAAVSDAHADLRKTPIIANRMVSTLRAMLTWAAAQRLIQFKNGNPARGHRRYKEVPSDRFLTVPELRAFIRDLPRAPMDDSTRAALMLELLLAQRSGEVLSMRKGDIDLVAASWTIPAPVMKSSTSHTVPLPPWARRIIAEAIARAKGPHLFPSRIGDPKTNDAKPIDAHALGTALRRAQRPVDDKGKPALKKPSDEWVFDFRDRHDAPNPVTPHDLRRTCSSYLELLGYSDVIRGAVLDHADSRNVTTKHYSAAELMKLKRTALLDWERALRQVMAGQDPFSATIEDDRAEEARKLGLDDPDRAPIPSEINVTGRRSSKTG